jgi:hypothetical protein
MARYRRIDLPGLEAKESAAGLDNVRTRRAGLKAAMSNLELALAAPAPKREVWVAGVRETLASLHEVLTRHVVETEAPGAFLDELVEESPRLATPAKKMRREHTELLGVITRAEEDLDRVPAGDEYDVWAKQLRADCTTLIIGLLKHRQRGADLVYEAYDVDIGGGF